jgi:translation initiation factor IF-3
LIECAFRVLGTTPQRELTVPTGVQRTWVRFFVCSHFSREVASLTVRSEGNEDRTRVNEQIRISPVRLIDADGEQVGIVPIEEARRVAADRELDLVEVAAMARPPVVKVMDYGKYRFEQAKAAKAAKKKQHVIHLKEVKYRPGVSDHDFNFKTRHARRFLEEGNKVKLTMMFRGRQVTHPELGREVLLRVFSELEDIAKVEMHPKLEGKNMTMVLAPR